MRHADSNASLHAQAKGLCGMLSWRGRCCEGSALFRTSPKEKDDGKLLSLVSSWSQKAPMADLATLMATLPDLVVALKELKARPTNRREASGKDVRSPYTYS